MHSFHPSRGRIFFEVLCALTVSASCAGAWVQTGASAFLPAAFAAALYGLWHMTDMAGGRPAVAVETGNAALAEEGQGDLIEYLETVEPEPAVYQAPEPETVDIAPIKAPPAKRRSRKKPATAPSPVESPAVECAVEEIGPEAAEAAQTEEEHHAPIAPLFEPQPLVRQPRPIFGRKAG